MANLEYRVREEVDKWEISVRGFSDQSVSYGDLIKPVLYGLGIAVTEKGIRLYSENGIEKLAKDYTNFTFNGAVDEFKKDLLVYHCTKHKNITALAGALSASREGIHKLLRRYELNFRGIKEGLGKEDDPVQTDPQLDMDEEKIINSLEREVKRYAEIMRPVLFGRLINDNSRDIAAKFSTLAKSIAQEDCLIDVEIYRNLPFDEAVKLFKTNYLKQQYIKYGNIQLAAKKSGISSGAFRKATCIRGISLRDLRK